MCRTVVLATLVLAIGLAVPLFAQDVDQRTQDLIESLDKTKYKKKDKWNVSVEMFIDIKNEAVVKEPAGYAGIYEADGFRLDLHVDRAGRASGSGYELYVSDDEQVNFMLNDATIDGALLTGTKVYATGESIPFEAVFVNRTSRTGKSPERVTETETRFGLGFLQHSGLAERGASKDAGWTNRLFLEKQ